MSQIHSRPVNPMSLMTDVFVELERLTRNLEQLRDELTIDDTHQHVELYEAKHNCRRIIEELQTIASLLRGAKSCTSATPSPRPFPTVVK